MDYRRMPIELEAPEEMGKTIRYNLCEAGARVNCLADLGISVPSDLSLSYVPHRGSPRLRSLIAQSWGVDTDDVLLTAAATSALFIVVTSILTKDDHMVMTRPYYPSNLGTAEAIGCDVSFVHLDFDRGFQLQLSELAAAIRPNTKLISLTNPNNPTGTSMSEQELRSVVELAKDRGCYILVDETYAELMGDSRLPSAATLGDHVIGVSSMSKGYSVPGIRVGWVMTKAPELQEKFLAAKEEMCITIGAVDEFIAEKILERREQLLARTLSGADKRRDLVDDWVKSDEMVEWVRPNAGLSGFIRLKREPCGGMAAFYDRLLKEHGAYVAPAHWFGEPGPFFRIGFGWPTTVELQNGLAAVSKALRG
ncbi:aspartate aminotransferase [Aspergillus alliaceus]|uniref:aspartate aminotransferase n=1 Tax=Petromyces alliaceus TaxID=209559 RepID=UPI0012A7024E|nr:aspartate aminotransferase [Aspergillus alliaceus]KAB8231127.1 aspartate aminotransferase [Aspergillus alliaceus]